MVRLIENFHCSGRNRLFNFNSSMVRLIEGGYASSGSITTEFQFQYGAIDSPDLGM